MGYSKEMLVSLGNTRWDFTWHSEYNMAMQGERSWTEAETRTELQRCSEVWRTCLKQTSFALVWQNEGGKEMRVLYQNVVGDRCHVENRITPEYFSFTVSRQVQLKNDVSFQVRAFNLKAWVLMYLFAAMSIHHYLSIPRDEWEEEITKLPSGCNLKMAQPISMNSVAVHNSTYILQLSKLLQPHHSFSSL